MDCIRNVIMSSILLVAEANVDGEEGDAENDTTAGRHTQDGVDGGVNLTQRCRVGGQSSICSPACARPA